MNKEEFLRELKSSLGELAPQEKNDIMADYEEHFRVGAEAGKSEAEIAAALGNPHTLGTSYRIDSLLDERQGRSAASVLRAVFAAMSLGFFNLVIVLGPFVGIVGVMIGLWATAAALALSGVGVVLSVAAQPIIPQYINTAGFHPAFLVFAGIGVAALGLLAVFAMVQLTKWVALLVARYVQLNVRVVTNRR